MNILLAEHTHFNSLFQVGCHHLAKEFASKGHSVTYISHCITPAHLLLLLTGQRKETAKKFKNFMVGGSKNGVNIYAYVPFSLIPIVKHFITDNMYIAGKHLELTVPGIKKRLSKKGEFDAVLIGDPQFVPLTRQVKAKQFILRLTDFVTEFDDSPRVNGEFINMGLKECSKIVVTSNPLKQLLSKQTDKPIHYVPNGVDIRHFTTAGRTAPGDLADIPSPRAVYVGAIDTWFDTDTICHTAKSVPDLQIILIGPPRINLNMLESLKNVHILGPRPYGEIPAYLQMSDIGIIPFKRTPLIEGVSPIKLYEYMACGLPVVTSAWKELEKIGSPASIAYNREEFAQLVRSRVAEGHRNSSIHREFALENSWEKRVNTLIEIING